MIHPNFYELFDSTQVKRLAIVGSREYANKSAVRGFIDTLPADVVIISGGARGVDRLADWYGRVTHHKVAVHLPKGYGAMWLHARNQDIANDCDAMICFWDGVSTGTQSARDKALSRGLRVVIVGPDGEVQQEWPHVSR